MATTKTLSDIRTACYNIIKQPENCAAYPYAILDTFINKSQNDICYGNVQNLQTNERLDKQALTFLEKVRFYETHRYSTLAADAVAGATTLTCTNTLASSGYIWINGAIISYSANDGTTLSGIPATGNLAIPFGFVEGTQVFQLDALPTDFGQVSRAFLTLDNTRYRQQLVTVDSRDLSSPIPNSGLWNFFFNQGYAVGGMGYSREWYYSMLQGQYVFFMTPQVDGNPISFEYQKAPTQLVNDSDVATVPDDYCLNTIPYMATAEMLQNRGEGEEAIRLNNFGFQNIKTMFEMYSTKRTELPYNVRIRSVSDGFGCF